MVMLTKVERKRLIEFPNGPTGDEARSTKQWVKILQDLSPHDAATRILSDLIGYTADRGGNRRIGFLDDVRRLANALDGWCLYTSTYKPTPK